MLLDKVVKSHRRTPGHLLDDLVEMVLVALGRDDFEPGQELGQLFGDAKALELLGALFAGELDVRHLLTDRGADLFCNLKKTSLSVSI